MELAERVRRYAAIESRRDRPLIIYATTTRPGLSAIMAGDAVRELIGQIDPIPRGSTAVDVLIHSTGGDALAAWKLMSVLRERFAKIGVLVPFMAFSAATLFALGADEIVMHPHSSLGPIDPQIPLTLPDGSQRRFSYEDVGAFLRFLKDEAGITDQAHVSAVADKLFSTVDPLILGYAKRASELSSSVGERLLKLHLNETEGEGRAKQIAENLNKSFFAHGDAVSRTRARELQLQVAKDDAELEALIWEAYLAIESYMELRHPFVPQRLFLADAAAAASVRPHAPVALPPNAPPQLVQNVWTTIGNQAVTAAAAAGVEVRYSVVNALMESRRAASEHRTEGAITGFRTPTGELQLNLLDREGGWKSVTVPPVPVYDAQGEAEARPKVDL
ncbi:MAG TPA: hypothetical protein VGQ75_10455 [Thermoanaerobaculia bacterium]|jgi:hypothetical protein|nr:hypothetical protein [Thermoanaerobaculia bacterium]HEV8608876.1 hypothetical protein [Thermoanaerobaculia bacterium]